MHSFNNLISTMDRHAIFGFCFHVESTPQFRSQVLTKYRINVPKIVQPHNLLWIVPQITQYPTSLQNLHNLECGPVAISAQKSKTNPKSIQTNVNYSDS